MTNWKKAVNFSDLINELLLMIMVQKKLVKRSRHVSGAKQDDLMSSEPHSCSRVCSQISHRETETRCCASDQLSSSNTQKNIKAGTSYKTVRRLSQKAFKTHEKNIKGKTTGGSAAQKMPAPIDLALIQTS